MIDGPIHVGDKLVWMPGSAFAMEMVVSNVRTAYRGADGMVWLKDPAGREYRDLEERVRHLCGRAVVADTNKVAWDSDEPKFGTLDPEVVKKLKSAMEKAYMKMYNCLTCKGVGRVEAPNAQFTTHCPDCNPDNLQGNRGNGWLKRQGELASAKVEFRELVDSLNPYEVAIATEYLKLLVKTRPQNASAKFTMGKI